MLRQTGFSTLEQWLAYCERLHPATIDLGLERVREVAQRMELRLTMPVITVAGTNGKGSTCAMLEAIYLQAGWRTGVYTSPHLVHFEERCRINGQPVEASALLAHFAAVEAARTQSPEIALTYFEFTTLAILRLLAAEPLDVVVLEVGLGGRLDATNIVDADCAIITSVDVDHTAFLGNDRESIGHEKAGIMRAGRAAIVSDPAPPLSVVKHAQETGADLWLNGRDFRHGGDRQQWNWFGRHRRYAALAWPALRGVNQLVNASGVLAAIEALHARLPVSAQAVRGGLATAVQPGRFQIVPGQPTLVLDVAHNPHAAAALAANLDAMGFYPVTHAVFGVMADKDVQGIWQKMRPLVSHWHFVDLPVARAMTAQQLRQKWQALYGEDGEGAQTFAHDSPLQGLRAASAMADPADRIIAFGSFYTVGAILAAGVPGAEMPRTG